MKRHVTYLCPNCLGDEVAGNADAYWDAEEQKWELNTVYDKGHLCLNHDCPDGYTNLDQYPIIRGEDTHEQGYNIVHLWGELNQVQVSQFFAVKDLTLLDKKFPQKKVYWNLAGTRQEHLYPILEEEAHRECPNCKSPNTKEESVNPYTCPNCVGELDTNF